MEVLYPHLLPCETIRSDPGLCEKSEILLIKTADGVLLASFDAEYVVSGGIWVDRFHPRRVHN